MKWVNCLLLVVLNAKYHRFHTEWEAVNFQSISSQQKKEQQEKAVCYVNYTVESSSVFVTDRSLGYFRSDIAVDAVPRTAL